MKNKYFISFAGVPGCGKSPVANYLSINLDLPILNNDNIRTEVKEDLGYFDQKEYERRRDERIGLVVNNGFSFIYDASMDRGWVNRRDRAVKAGYKYCVISFDLSKEFILHLHEVKDYTDLLHQMNELIADHDSFLKEFGHEVNIQINDDNYLDRLEIALRGVEGWLKEQD